MGYRALLSFKSSARALFTGVCALTMRRSCIIVIGGETAARYPRTRSPAKILRLKDCADSFFLDRMNLI